MTAALIISYSANTSLVKSASSLREEMPLAAVVPRCTSSPRSSFPRVMRACSVPASPNVRIRPTMAAVIFARRLTDGLLLPPSGRHQRSHLPYTVVDAIVGDDEAIDKQGAEDLPTSGVRVHPQQDLPQSLLQRRVQPWPDDHRIDAERPPLRDHFRLARVFRPRLRQVVVDPA